MTLTGTFFTKAYPLFVLSGLNTVILLLVFIAMVIVVIGFYRSAVKGYQNDIDALQQQVADMQQHLAYASQEETKARADAKRSAAARDKLLVSLNHEIRTPMNGILGMAILLEETNPGPEQKDYIDTIISSGKILLNKVDEVIANDELEQSKIDRTINVAQQKATDIRNCVEEVIENFAVKAAEKETELLYKIENDVPQQVLADNKRLQQVLTNLVENIMETQTEPQVVISVHLIKHSSTDTPPLLGFTIGTKPAERAIRAAARMNEGGLLRNASADEEQNDTLLGITISKKLVEEMNGEIRKAYGMAGFVFSIPLHPVAVQKRGEGYSLKDFEGKRVLVINSRPDAAQILTKQLQQWKLVPDVAGSREEAMKLTSKQPYHLIITDMNLPGSSGTELLMDIKKTNPQTPLLLLSPVNDKRVNQYKETAADITILNKPLKQHVLFDNILRLLRQNKKAGQVQDMSVKKLSDDFSKQYPLRILVAEDNDVNQKWALKILSKMGYQPDIAGNGHIALEMVGKTAYDLILMDVQMPEMDGLEATRMIRVCLSKQPVIIAMTANAMHGDRMACMQAGMDDYISKPVQLGELVNILEKWALVITDKRLEETATAKRG
jgi:CheY-like chemotaxis protein